MTQSGAQRPPFVSAAEGGWHLLVRVQPGARKTECAGLWSEGLRGDERLRVRLAAPAVENKANKALTAFIAKTLGLRAAKVTLLAGHSSREKRLLVEAGSEPDWGALMPPED